MFAQCLLFMLCFGSLYTYSYDYDWADYESLSSPTSTTRRATSTTWAPTTQRVLGVHDSLSCNFDNRMLCGWTNYWQSGNTWDVNYDENYYDSDINRSLRVEDFSSGPSRLISPLYSSAFDDSWCFLFDYEWSSNDWNTNIRVYQKPASLTLAQLLSLSEYRKSAYTIFEIRGVSTAGRCNSVSYLKQLNNEFQIIIEGSSSFSGMPFYMAIDNIDIRQGRACVAASYAASTPPPERLTSRFDMFTSTTTSTTTTTTTTTTPRPTTIPWPRTSPPTTTLQRTDNDGGLRPVDWIFFAVLGLILLILGYFLWFPISRLWAGASISSVPAANADDEQAPTPTAAGRYTSIDLDVAADRESDGLNEKM